MAAARSSEPRPGLAFPSGIRIGALVVALLLGWAVLVPTGSQWQWWQPTLGVLVAVLVLGSWNGLLLTTAATRWVPMRVRNRQRRNGSGRGRRRASAGGGRRKRGEDMASAEGSTSLSAVGEVTVTLRVQPQPHQVATADAAGGQLPWQQLLVWLDRYGVRADAMTVTSVATTPAPSALRQAQSRSVTDQWECWITFVFSTVSNMEALKARSTVIDELAKVTTRRMVGELRERGWVVAVVEDSAEFPRFVDRSARVRRECWTGTEYGDGFRAVYAVEPSALSSVVAALPGLATKCVWTSVTVRSQGRQGPTVEAFVAMLTAARPDRVPLKGLTGFDGLHRVRAEAVSIADAGVQLPRTELDVAGLQELRWQLVGAGVPIGSNKQGQPEYLGLDSVDPVRITVTGDPAFQLGMCSRLALSGRPMGIYVAQPDRFRELAANAAVNQIQPAPKADQIGRSWMVVGDDSRRVPAAHTTVLLRGPSGSEPAETSINITQDSQNRHLFTVGGKTLAVQLN